MNKRMSKRQRDIKSKLMAAIAMLLVSSIMMVSTTYAWFTLSTAPEVTGITTSVGANGNLEMALMPEDALSAVGDAFGITSDTGDSSKPVIDRNITWGNLVELEDASYGLNTVSLYPAELNATAEDELGNPTSLGAAFLRTPLYGSDGRISQLEEKTVTGLFDGTAFNSTTNELGVRAVGNASGMSARQIAYRNALQAGSTNASQANTKVANSLNSRGSSLASIAIKHGTAAEGSDTYTTADVASLRGMIDDLRGNGETVGVLQYIEKAYVKYIEAFVTSSLSNLPDETAELFSSAVANIDTVAALRQVAADNGVTLDTSAVDSYLTALEATKAKVNAAHTALAALETSGQTSFTWTEISGAMTPLVDAAALKVNGFTVSELKGDPNGFMQKYFEDNGIIVTLASGAGVYADIADHVGNYQASITIASISYGGTINLNNIPAIMNTNTSGTPNLTVLHGAMSGHAPTTEGTTEAAPITDMYGYVIDLAFRTNASDSKLLLQTEAAGRIYGDEDGAETMGHGATMTFESTVPSFSVEKVQALMKSIRIVFFNPQNSSILATAKLCMDEGAYTTVGTAVTAPIKLYKTLAAGEGTTTYEPATEGATHYLDADQTYKLVPVGTHYYDGENYQPVGDTGETATHYNAGTEDAPNIVEVPEATHKAVTTAAGTSREQWLTDTDAVITPLTQNVAHAVSVLVYLDGNTVTNADVAAVANTSAVGTMNLQFSSTANLVPMEYTALKNQGGTASTTTPEETDPTAKLASGSAAGITLSDVAFNEGTITFKLAGTADDTTYTVTVGGQTLTASAEGVYTVSDVTADVEVMVAVSE